MLDWPRSRKDSSKEKGGRPGAVPPENNCYLFRSDRISGAETLRQVAETDATHIGVGFCACRTAAAREQFRSTGNLFKRNGPGAQDRDQGACEDKLSHHKRNSFLWRKSPMDQ